MEEEDEDVTALAVSSQMTKINRVILRSTLGCATQPRVEYLSRTVSCLPSRTVSGQQPRPAPRTRRDETVTLSVICANNFVRSTRAHRRSGGRDVAVDPRRASHLYRSERRPEITSKVILQFPLRARPLRGDYLPNSASPWATNRAMTSIRARTSRRGRKCPREEGTRRARWRDRGNQQKKKEKENFYRPRNS